MDKLLLDDGWIAERVGCDRSHVSRLRRKLVNPSLPLAYQLVKITQGAVQFDELLMDQDKRR